MSGARTQILARLRAAVADAPSPEEVRREYRHAEAAGPGDPVALFTARLAEYGTRVRAVPPEEVAAAVEAACGERGARRIAVPAVPAVTLPVLEMVMDDPPLTLAQLDAIDGVLTGCALAIAATGTIVLDGSPRCGRRALTLVPDYHLCVVEERQIVGGVPEAVAALEPAAGEARPLTWISGPSATSDIEFERVQGVHGPRTLEVVVVG